jgi:putative transposase
MGFKSDAMAGNRKFLTLNVIDNCSREALAIEIYALLSSITVIRTLDRIIEQRDKAPAIRTENCTEFT